VSASAAEYPMSVMLIFCMEIELSKSREKKLKIKPFMIENGSSPSQTLKNEHEVKLRDAEAV